jgi:hypothetical protein
LAEDELESLAYGRDCLKSIQKHLGGNIRTYEPPLESYKHGKERIRSALQDMDTSFGVRLEMRLAKTWYGLDQEANIGNKVSFFLLKVN